MAANAKFIKGSNDWDKNEQSVDLGSSGSKRLNIGTIKSKTASQEIVLYPDLTRLFENKIIKSDIEKDVMRNLKKRIESEINSLIIGAVRRGILCPAS